MGVGGLTRNWTTGGEPGFCQGKLGGEVVKDRQKEGGKKS